MYANACGDDWTQKKSLAKSSSKEIPQVLTQQKVEGLCQPIQLEASVPIHLQECNLFLSKCVPVCPSSASGPVPTRPKSRASTRSAYPCGGGYGWVSIEHLLMFLFLLEYKITASSRLPIFHIMVPQTLMQAQATDLGMSEYNIPKSTTKRKGMGIR